MSKSESLAKEGLMNDMRHPLLSNCLVVNECIIAVNESIDIMVIANVRSEHDHGL